MHWLNAETGELLATTSRAPPAESVTGVAFSGDGSRVASVAEDGTRGDLGSVLVQTDRRFQRSHARQLTGWRSPPMAAGWPPVADSRDAVKLWDLSTHRELMTLPGQGSLFSFVAFSPDGRWLAACSYMEGQLHLWRAPSWAEIEAAEKGLGSGQSP